MFVIETLGDLSVAKVEDDLILTESLILDLIGNAYYNYASVILTKRENFPVEFFDLKTKIAGNIFQKFSNYKMKLVIIGDFSNIPSKSLADFIFESNKNRVILFLTNEDELLNYL